MGVSEDRNISPWTKVVVVVVVVEYGGSIVLYLWKGEVVAEIFRITLNKAGGARLNAEV